MISEGIVNLAEETPEDLNIIHHIHRLYEEYWSEIEDYTAIITGVSPKNKPWQTISRDRG
jgi:hypothetical protein